MSNPDSTNDRLRMSGESARIIIKNTYSMLRHKFRGDPLWSLVGYMTGHGSGYSHDICRSANLNPSQVCGKEGLEDWKS